MSRKFCGGLILLFAVCTAVGSSTAQITINPSDAKPAPINTPLGHVEILGTGPIDMVLIPGLYVDWTIWESFMRRNAGQYTMYAVTLPGFGATGAPPIQRGQTYSSKMWITNVVERVAEMIEERELDNPVIVGHSLGAQVAMRLATEHAEQVSRIVNLDSLPATPLPGRPPDVQTSQAMRNKLVDEEWAPAMEQQGALTWQKAQEIYMQGQMRDLTRAAEIGDMAGAVPKEIAARYFLELVSEDLNDEILAMDTPMLVIGTKPSFEVMGGRPGSVPADWSRFEAMIEGHDHIQFLMFHDCAHYITEDAPDRLDEAIADFIADDS